jgi:hypothetical protein
MPDRFYTAGLHLIHQFRPFSAGNRPTRSPMVWHLRPKHRQAWSFPDAPLYSKEEALGMTGKRWQ